MLNRRHIRVKVMQTIYAMHQSGSDDIVKYEKFLNASLENSFDLYLIILTTLIEIRKKEVAFIEISKNKHLASKKEQNPNLRFINNPFLLHLENSKSINEALLSRKINNWQINDDTILFLLQDVKNRDVYLQYMEKPKSTVQDDLAFVNVIFTDVIAPNEKLYSYLEDFKLTWVDDIPVVNTLILKQLNQLNLDFNFRISSLYKNTEDSEFGLILFRKTILNQEKLEKEFVNKTPNWDIDRIAEVDVIVLKMAICEFLHFPQIPLKVTINEYLEISKEYSTSKSSIFINGILDNIVKDLESKGKITKVGRGLL